MTVKDRIQSNKEKKKKRSWEREKQKKILEKKLNIVKLLGR